MLNIVCNFLGNREEGQGLEDEEGWKIRKERGQLKCAEGRLVFQLGYFHGGLSILLWFLRTFGCVFSLQLNHLLELRAALIVMHLRSWVVLIRAVQVV